MNSFLEQLKSASSVSQPDLELRWILEKFGPEDSRSIQDAILRRQKGEPLAYILGEREFYGITFKVTPDVLIPRPETELLVDLGIEYANLSGKNLHILDMGCGSGCIGLSLLMKLPKANLVSIDLSAKAVEVSKQNAEILKLGARSKILAADAAKSSVLLTENFDLIVANPPYIEKTSSEQDTLALSYEPQSALYAENEGMACIEQWLPEAVKLLKSQGVVAFEIGYDQGYKTQQAFESLQFFDRVSIHKDLAGHDRVVVGIKES